MGPLRVFSASPVPAAARRPLRLGGVAAVLAAGLVAAALPAVPAAAVPAVPAAGERIFGGKVADVDPGAATVFWPDTPYSMCSASVIAPQWILTAAHCVPGMVKPGKLPITVRTGLDSTKGPEYVVAEHFYQKKNGTRPSADLALLKLTAPIPDPTIMPLADAEAPIPSDNQLYGFGRACDWPESGPETCPVSTVLRTATVRHTARGIDYYYGPALYSTGGDGSARTGDSGGPQVYQGKQIGVASTAAKGYQNYASVPHSRAWIRQTAGV